MVINKSIKKMISICMVLMLMLVIFSGCKKRSEDSSGVSSDANKSNNLKEFENMMDRKLLYGIGEPLYLRAANGEANIDKSIELMVALGVKSFRLWMNFPDILTSPTTVDAFNASMFQTIIDKCKENDIAVIGMSHYLGYKGGQFSIPRRDLTEGSDYIKFMNDFEKSWETMAKTFPDITFWQLGNENNGDMFMHPYEYESDKTTVFTYPEKAEIVLDMCLYGTRGIHAGNKDSKSILPPLTPYESQSNAGLDMGVVDSFLTLLYENIESGDWGTTNSDDFFQVLSWHPYFLQGGPSYEEEPNDFWVECNNKIFAVAQKHGDGDKPVFFTEFGYSDRGFENVDKIQGDQIYNALKYVEEQMPYVKVFNVFRMYDDPRAYVWGGEYQVYFGLFKVEDGKIIAKNKGRGYMRYTDSVSAVEEILN